MARRVGGRGAGSGENWSTKFINIISSDWGVVSRVGVAFWGDKWWLSKFISGGVAGAPREGRASKPRPRVLGSEVRLTKLVQWPTVASMPELVQSTVQTAGQGGRGLGRREEVGMARHMRRGSTGSRTRSLTRSHSGRGRVQVIIIPGE